MLFPTSPKDDAKSQRNMLVKVVKSSLGAAIGMAAVRANADCSCGQSRESCLCVKSEDLLAEKWYNPSNESE
jgi:hypothetical protein